MEGDIFRGQRTLCVDSPVVMGEAARLTFGKGSANSGGRDGVLVKTGYEVPEVKGVGERARYNKS